MFSAEKFSAIITGKRNIIKEGKKYKVVFGGFPNKPVYIFDLKEPSIQEEEIECVCDKKPHFIGVTQPTKAHRGETYTLRGCSCKVKKPYPNN